MHAAVFLVLLYAVGLLTGIACLLKSAAEIMSVRIYQAMNDHAKANATWADAVAHTFLGGISLFSSFLAGIIFLAAEGVIPVHMTFVAMIHGFMLATAIPIVAWAFASIVANLMTIPSIMLKPEEPKAPVTE